MGDKRFEPVPLAAGPRDLPSWAKDAHINWMEGYGNSPRLKVRCAVDPLAFSRSGNPAWERRANGCWVAEGEGVAAVHWHGGQVCMTEFERHLGWAVKPAPENNWKGEAEVEKYRMLATTQQEGYAGRHFDITLKDGTPVRLRGPWHAGGPPGFMEISYDIDEDIARYRNPRARFQRKWHQRGGYFGLYIKPEIVLDIFATFLPHVPWCWTYETVRDGTERRRLEPMRPETHLPKGWLVPADECPGHRFGATGSEHPADRCTLCGQRRDPAWKSPYEKAAA